MSVINSCDAHLDLKDIFYLCSLRWYFYCTHFDEFEGELFSNEEGDQVKLFQNRLILPAKCSRRILMLKWKHIKSMTEAVNSMKGSTIYEGTAVAIFSEPITIVGWQEKNGLQ